MSLLSPRHCVLIGFSLLLLGCKHSPEPLPSPPEAFGADGKLPLRMVVAGGYLYVCASSKGLWRRETASNYRWQALGLADPRLPVSVSSGVTDVSVSGQTILASYNGSSKDASPDSAHAIWRSTDSGTSWFPSDQGVPETRDHPTEFDHFDAIARSPQDPNVVIAPLGPSFYLSSDGGTHWVLHGVRGLATVEDNVMWHPLHAGEFWTFGQTGYFEAYLVGKRDFGQGVFTSVSFSTTFGLANEGAVSDLAFDSAAPDTMFAATNYGVFTTTDGGSTWQFLIHGSGTVGYIYHIVSDPQQAHTFLFSTAHNLYRSVDGLRSFNLMYSAPAGSILALALDPLTRTVFVGTDIDVVAVAVP